MMETTYGNNFENQIGSKSQFKKLLECLTSYMVLNQKDLIIRQGTLWFIIYEWYYAKRPYGSHDTAHPVEVVLSKMRYCYVMVNTSNIVLKYVQNMLTTSHLPRFVIINWNILGN